MNTKLVFSLLLSVLVTSVKAAETQVMPPKPVEVKKWGETLAAENTWYTVTHETTTATFEPDTFESFDCSTAGIKKAQKVECEGKEATADMCGPKTDTYTVYKGTTENPKGTKCTKAYIKTFTGFVPALVKAGAKNLDVVNKWGKMHDNKEYWKTLTYYKSGDKTDAKTGIFYCADGYKNTGFFIASVLAIGASFLY